MKIRTLRRGMNKDECLCGSAKDIKSMLEELPLDDTYEVVLNMGDCITRDKISREIIFKLIFYSKSRNSKIYHNFKIYQDNIARIWFTFNPIKKSRITGKIREDFKIQIIPLLKSEILDCIERSSIIQVKSLIILLENGQFVIERENK